jgi:hypothetical protein
LPIREDGDPDKKAIELLFFRMYNDAYVSGRNRRIARNNDTKTADDTGPVLGRKGTELCCYGEA